MRIRSLLFFCRRVSLGFQGLGCDADSMPLLSGGLGALGVVTATFLVEAHPGFS